MHVYNPPSPGWMKFNVVGIAMEDEARCSGVLRDEKRMVRLLFSGPFRAMGPEMAGVIIIIKTALEMYIDMGWHVKVSLITDEFSLGDALESLLKKNYRPWTLWNLFIITDRCINQLGRLTSHWYTNMVMVWLML